LSIEAVGAAVLRIGNEETSGRIPNGSLEKAKATTQRFHATTPENR
jgi:hypothetical protein